MLRSNTFPFLQRTAHLSRRRPHNDHQVTCSPPPLFITAATTSSTHYTMPGAVVGNATRIWELNVHWTLYSQCGVWDPRGRGVDIWECIRDRECCLLRGCQPFVLHLPFSQTTQHPVHNLPTRHIGDISLADNLKSARTVYSRSLASFLTHTGLQPATTLSHRMPNVGVPRLSWVMHIIDPHCALTPSIRKHTRAMYYHLTNFR